MKTFFLALLIASFSLPLYAQEEPDDAPNEAPFTGVFGFGGGVDGIYYFVNTTELNAALTERAMPELDGSGMFLFGGHGYVYIMFIPNFRIGGMGAGGTLRSENIVDGQRQSSELATAFGGFTMEYTIPFGQFHIGLGALIGGGGNTISLTRETDGPKSWGDVPVNAGRRAVLENSFLAYQPTLTLEYMLNPLMIVSVAGGYFGTSGDSWELNDEFDIADMPDFSFNNAFVRLQLTFGIFIGE